MGFNVVRAAAVLGVAAGSTAFGAQIQAVTNGGFETGTLAPWGASPNASVSSTSPHTGTYSAFLNNNIGAPNNENILQTTAAASVLPGAPYTFSFYDLPSNLAAGGEGQVELQFFDASNTFLGSSGVQIFAPASSPTYSQYSLTGTTPTTADHAQVFFYAVTGGAPGSTAQIYVDDVSLLSGTATVSSVPEPASLGILGLGMAAVMLRRRRAV